RAGPTLPGTPQSPPQLPVPHLPAREPMIANAAPAGETSLLLTEAKPMSVVFEPWPAMLVPSRGIAPEVIAFHQPRHAISQQYAALLVKIVEGQTGTGTKTILLSGSKPNVGATTALL